MDKGKIWGFLVQWENGINKMIKKEITIIE